MNAVEREMRRRLACKTETEKDNALVQIAQTLYPNGDLRHVWSPDELDNIATVISNLGLYPNE